VTQLEADGIATADEDSGEIDVPWWTDRFNESDWLRGRGATLWNKGDSEVASHNPTWVKGEDDLSDEDMVRIAQTKSITRLDLSYCVELSCSAVNLIWQLPHLDTVSLISCSQLTDAAFAGISQAKSLTRLELGWCVQISGAGWSTSVPKSLQFLDLTKCTPFSEDALLDILARCPLLELYAGEVHGVTDRVLVQASLISTLHSLNVGGASSVTERGLLALATSGTLRWVDLGEIPAVNDTVVDHLSRNPHIHTLSLSYTAITDKAMESLGNAEGVRHLAISGCREVTWEGIAMALSNRALKTLHAYGFDIPPEHLKYLKELRPDMLLVF